MGALKVAAIGVVFAAVSMMALQQPMVAADCLGKCVGKCAVECQVPYDVTCSTCYVAKEVGACATACPAGDAFTCHARCDLILKSCSFLCTGTYWEKFDCAEAFCAPAYPACASACPIK